MKNNILIIIFCLSALSAIFVIAYWAGKQKRVNWITSVGIVTRLSYGRSGTRTFEYTDVEGNIVTAEGSYGLPGRCVGDRFEIQYNPRNKKQIYVLEERPLLDEGAFDTVIGYVVNSAEVRLEDSSKKGTVDFEYSVNGHNFNRTQLVSISADQTWNIKKGTEIMVLYSQINPQRAILKHR